MPKRDVPLDIASHAAEGSGDDRKFTRRGEVEQVAGTSLEQFRNSILSPSARAAIGLNLDDAQAQWVADDPARLESAYAAWLVSRSAPPAAPPTQLPPSQPYGYRPPLAQGQYYQAGFHPMYPQAPPAPYGYQQPTEPDFSNTPGRISGFVFALISALFIALPVVCLPLSIVGIVLCSKALKLIPPTARGRGLAATGLGISIAATSLCALIMVAAIPGAWESNFGS